MRPSTTRLDRNLRALAAEFALRDMGCVDVGLFLGCSPSSARNYINHLLDAGMVAPRRTGGTGGRARTVYRMKPHATIADLPCVAAALRAECPPVVVEPSAVGHAPDEPPMLRDPLVAALFGRPSATTQA